MSSKIIFADGSTFTIAPSTSGDKNNNSVSTSQNDPDEMYYNMRGKKYLLVFNHHMFKKTIHFGNRRPHDREGTIKDMENLKRVFKKLHYDVRVYNDRDYHDIMKIINDISEQDHSNTACLCVAILTHGDNNNVLYAANMPYSLGDITNKLENGNESLAKIPKLFFIQACRGYKVDAGRTVQIDGADSSKLNETDIYVSADISSLSSIPEGTSFWNAKGSVLLQKLCRQWKTIKTNTCQGFHYLTTLNNKQVRRGDNLDAEGTVKRNGTGSSMVVSSTPNFLIFRSSVEGYISFRNINGSFLIQELCKAVEDKSDEDIHYITTLVNRRVAYNYRTYTPDSKKMNNKKQMTEVTYTLNKLFQF